MLPGAKRDDIGQSTDRRGHQRIRSIGRVGRVDAAGDRGLCRVHDMSDGGMKIETNMEMRPGEWVTVSFDGSRVLHGRLVWRNGSRMGIQLTRPIDCCSLIRDLAKGQWDGTIRSPRLPVNGRAHLVSALGNFAAELVDISQKGLKIRLPGGLPEGLSLEIRLDAGIHVKGVVCWSDSNLVGLELSGMIAVERLASAAAL